MRQIDFAQCAFINPHIDLETGVLHAVDGKTSLSQIAALTGKSEAQLLPVVTRLAKAGLVKFPHTS